MTLADALLAQPEASAFEFDPSKVEGPLSPVTPSPLS
jgi:hypothetical protein